MDVRLQDRPTRPPHAPDHWRVNLAEAWELAFWSREFACSEAQLREAVRQVGDNAGAVRARLGQRQPS
jgi:hypothetical protein